MPDTRRPLIQYAVVGQDLYLACRERATHEVSLAADALVHQYLEAGPTAPRVVLDLSACQWLDSTFAGWLLKLRQRMQAAGGRGVLSGCPDGCRATLDVMGLSALLVFEDVPEPENLQTLSCAGLHDDPAAIDFIVHAHEDLAELSAGNKETFLPLAELLRREMEKRIVNEE